MVVEIAGRIVFTALMLAVMVLDMRSLRIPDRLNLLIAAAFVPFAALQNLPWEVLLSHMGMAAFLFAGFLIVAVMGPMGGGDVKLAGVVGLWIGTGQEVVFWLVVSTAVYALFLVIAIYVRRFGVRYMFQNIELPSWLHDLLSREVPLRKSIIPFGVPLAIGAIFWAWT